jgi:hypothetical protein
VAPHRCGRMCGFTYSFAAAAAEAQDVLRLYLSGLNRVIGFTVGSFGSVKEIAAGLFVPLDLAAAALPMPPCTASMRDNLLQARASAGLPAFLCPPACAPAQQSNRPRLRHASAHCRLSRTLRESAGASRSQRRRSRRCSTVARPCASVHAAAVLALSGRATRCASDSQPGSASCADGMQAAYAQMQTVDANGFRAFSIGSKPPVSPSPARC